MTEGNRQAALGLPLERALELFDAPPSILEIHPPRGARDKGSLRVVRYDKKKHELTVARFIDDAIKGDPI